MEQEGSGPKRSTSKEELNAPTEKIIECAFRVANTLGSGFLEKVYENALAHELRKCGYHVDQQEPLTVIYDSVVVADYQPDLLVEYAVIVEIKAARDHHDIFDACCINYLAVTQLPVCLLLNFAKARLGINRFIGESFKSLPQSVA